MFFLDELLESYRAYLADEKHASQNTLSSYMRDLNQFAAWLKEHQVTDLSAVKQSTVSEYVEWMTSRGKSAATVTRSIASIKSLYAYLQGKGVVKSNPAKGVATVGLKSGIPTLFGIVTTDTIEQAIERAGTKAGNKGYDVACSAIEMINLVNEINN